jgi:hypothetical protein
MPKVKVLKGVAHNIGDSFTSLMNYCADDYSMGHILRFARESGINTLTIDSEFSVGMRDGTQVALLRSVIRRGRRRLNDKIAVAIPEPIVKSAALHRKNALFYRTLNGAQVGDLFMSLIHSCQLCGANSLDYLVELQRHARELAACPADWMPWNYRDTLARTAQL